MRVRSSPAASDPATCGASAVPVSFRLFRPAITTRGKIPPPRRAGISPTNDREHQSRHENLHRKERDRPARLVRRRRHRQDPRPPKRRHREPPATRKPVASGKRVSERMNIGGRRLIKKKQRKK